MDDDYISLNDLKNKISSNETHLCDKHFEQADLFIEPENFKKCYQVHFFDINHVKINHVGYLKDISHVLINEFNLKQKINQELKNKYSNLDGYQCKIISCIYDESILDQNNFNLFQLLISKNNIINYQINFTFSTIKKKENYFFEGIYNFMFVNTIKKNKIILNKCEHFVDHIEIIDNLLEYLFDETILNIINT